MDVSKSDLQLWLKRKFQNMLVFGSIEYLFEIEKWYSK